MMSPFLSSFQYSDWSSSQRYDQWIHIILFVQAEGSLNQQRLVVRPSLEENLESRLDIASHQDGAVSSSRTARIYIPTNTMLHAAPVMFISNKGNQDLVWGAEVLV
ncbi:hypothetical protein Droror1_Dr00017242 [Drosera rotundifolia]